LTEEKHLGSCHQDKAKQWSL